MEHINQVASENNSDVSTWQIDEFEFTLDKKTKTFTGEASYYNEEKQAWETWETFDHQETLEWFARRNLIRLYSNMDRDIIWQIVRTDGKLTLD